MSDFMFVALTVLFIVIAAVMILKKMDSKLVFFFVGTLALLVVTAITGVSVLGEKTTGNIFLDVVDVIRTKFISTVQGTGIRLMVVAGYVMLMNHMKASNVLAAAAGKVLIKLKNPYLILAASKGARVAYKAAMDSLPFNQMLDIDGNKNWFAVDNYINDALVTGYYRDAKSLQRAYEQHNDILTPSVFALSDRPALTDEDLRFKRGLKTLSTKERRKQIVKLLEYLGNNDLTEQEREFKADLRRTDSFIVEAYELVGKEVIEELDYSYPEIKKRMIVAQYQLGAKGTETIQLIKTSFKVGMKYRLTYIKEELIRIFELLGVTPPNKITAQSINSYFETKEVWIKKDKALLLVREKV